MSMQEAAIRAATSALKTQGNDLFQQKRFARAICKYDSALMVMLNPMVEDPDFDDPETKQLLVAIYSNKAEACLKLGAFGLAGVACECALRHDPHHAKSLYRKKRAAEAERLHEKDSDILEKHFNEFREVAAKDECDKEVESISKMMNFMEEKIKGSRQIRGLKMCATLYWSNFKLTGHRGYLELASRFAQNCLELCETFTSPEKRFEIDPKTTDPGHALAELVVTKAECGILVAFITACLTEDRTAAAPKIAAVVSEITELPDRAIKYYMIAPKVAEVKLKAFSAIVELESESQQWTKAKTAAQNIESILTEHSLTEDFVHKHAGMVLDTAFCMIEGADCTREVMCRLFYAIADGYCQHNRYDDAAQTFRKLLNTRRESWRLCSPSQSPLPPNKAEKQKEEDDTKSLLSLIEKAGREPGSSCSICMESLKSDVIVATKCLHVFHFRCICKWFQNKPKELQRESEEYFALTSDCPNCRESIEVNVNVK